MRKIFLNKEIINSSWIIGGKIIQMLISLVVSILTTRYLGPSNFGIINYASAYVIFFSAISTLGINSIIVKEFADNPEKEGEILGSTIVLRFLSSLFSIIVINGIVFVLDHDEKVTIAVVFLCSLSIAFQIFDSITYWFQSRYRAKVTAIAGLIGYIVASIYKVALLILNKNVEWFAFATSVDYICMAFFLMLSYKKYNGPKLSFDYGRGKKLVSKSYHYILSGLMIAIYGQTDKFMIKQMLSEKEVAYYSVATAICTMWVFVLQAIIDSAFPTIVNYYKNDYEKYKKKNIQLYSIIFYVSVGISVLFTLFGKYIIILLYGEAYIDSVLPLKIVTWYTAFSYLGVARNAWIVCENKQKYLKYIYGSAAILNVILNACMIPWWGTAGAALASLITNIATSILLPLGITELQPNAKLMLDAILLKGIIKK